MAAVRGRHGGGEVHVLGEGQGVQAADPLVALVGLPVFQVVADLKTLAEERGEAPQRGGLEGLLAVCLQHEIEHLQGKIFVKHLSLLKQTRIKAKLSKQARITA